MIEPDEFEVEAEGYFSIIPEWILDADISDRAYRLYGTLRRYAGGEVRPSRKKLAERLRTSLSSIDRALRELQTVGAVTVRHRWTDKGRTSITYDKDADHKLRLPSRYYLHNTPAVRKPSGRGVVTGDAGSSSPVMLSVVTSDDDVSSPVTRGVSSPMTRGV